MTVPEFSTEKAEYAPTSSQQERGAAIKRFNRYFVYTPILFFAILAVLITLILLYLSLNPPTLKTEQTISGIADAVVILGTIPAIIVCGLIPTLALVITVQAKNRGMAPIQQLQTLLWRMDSGVGMVRGRVEKIAPQIARPFISFHANFAYIQTLTKKIIQLFRRS